jgi:hypothetical protein
MSPLSGIPKQALISLGDMLDSCARVQPGNEVLLVADVKGLYGGDDMVDREAISWIQNAVQARGANASVLWIDETPKVHAWRFSPVAKAAMSACDVLINNCFFTLANTEITEFRDHFLAKKFKYIRNFATTAPLLCTAWAQTPTELVYEITYQASLAFIPGASFQLTDPNGTHLEGIIRDPKRKEGIPGGLPYSTRRGVSDKMYPWPEWMHTPVNVLHTSGVYIFDCMLSWWSRYIGISPYFDKPIELVIKDNRITEIKGGYEADALRRFLIAMVDRLGNDVYNFEIFHFGVHPQASVGPHQCPNPLYRRIIEHAHTRDLHFHIGNASPTAAYPYYLHCTADIRTPTLRVGDTMVYDRGHLMALDSPAVIAVEKKYPGRPGVAPEPRLF